MGTGDLTASLGVLVDRNDEVLIKSTIDALNLAVVTDHIFVIDMGTQGKVMIFKVEREA